MASEKVLEQRLKKVILASLRAAKVRVSAKYTLSKLKQLYHTTFGESAPSKAAMNQKWWYQRNVKLTPPKSLKTKKRKR